MQLFRGDCLDVLPTLADKSVDLILAGIGKDPEMFALSLALNPDGLTAFVRGVA